MIKPLLYLLQKGNLDGSARLGITEELLGIGRDKPLRQNKGSLPVRNIVIVTAFYSTPPIEIILNALKRYPQLSTLKMQIHHTSQREIQRVQLSATQQIELDSAEANLIRDLTQADLLINTSASEEGITTMLEAMASGVPVLIPDSIQSDVTFLKDGINGFLYRTHDADSLAISLLTLQSVSHDVMQRVVTHARATITDMQLESSSFTQSAL